MNAEWSLTGLYAGFDDPALGADLAACQALVAEFAAFSETLEGEPAQVALCAIRSMEQGEELLSKVGAYAGLCMAANAKDEAAAACMGKVLALSSSVTGPQTLVRRYLAAQDIDAMIAAEPELEPFRYLLECIKDDDQYLLSAQEEQLMAMYAISGSSAWDDMRNYLTASVPVTYRGEITNLSDIRNKAYDPDPAVRKDAYEAELACYDRIRDAVAFSLNSIKLEVLNRCRLKGFESPLDEALHQSRMKAETLDALLTAMVEYMPRFRDYLKAKARYLGHENGLPWYDLFAPMGGNDRKYTTQEARDYLLGIFSQFDASEAQMIARAFDESWIDFFPRDGKSGGAFCAEVYSLKQSRILTNFDGQFGDIVTLAHELGHAFHNQQVFGNSILNTQYSMPVAETASTFNEILTMKTAIAQEQDPQVKLALLESRLMDTTQIICDIYSRYLFEKAVFDNRDEGFLFPDRLCQLMLDAQREAYGDGLDPDCLHPYMWVCKSHYYSGSLSYYNWPYAFGGLFGMGLYAKYRQQGPAFVPLYKKMLNATATSSVEDAAAIAGIDVTDPDFWRMSLDAVAQEIDEFIALTEQVR